MNNNSTLVILPAHNEEECITEVVQRLKKHDFSHIRVVDNGSTDATARLARAAGAEVISLPGRGYGLACWAGGQSLSSGIKWLLYCNADASDDFKAYEEFARLAPNHDLILGARTHPEDRRHMSTPQRFGNWLAPFLIRRLWGHDFADLGPQRAIRVEAYHKLKMQDRGFGWTIEMQIRALEENLRIIEIPVRTYPRPAGKSKISGNLRGSVMAGSIILATLARLRLRQVKAGLVSSPEKWSYSGIPGTAGVPPSSLKSPDAVGNSSDAGQRPAVPGGFSATLEQHGLTLRRRTTEILQINTGKLCNLTCMHCHVNAGPKRKEIITRPVIDQILAWLETTNIHTVDLTGGAPEMIPDFRYFIEKLRTLPQVRTIIDRCNLTILVEPGYEEMAAFLAKHHVTIIASMPCYEPANVNAQRGEGVFDASIKGLQILNQVGYSRDPSLQLDLVYNPNGAFLPPAQEELQADYKRELKAHFDIDFGRLFAITNMPIARYKSWLKNNGKLDDYMTLLRDSFNPAAVEGLMCRDTLSIGWMGEVFDCDFNQQLGMQWKNGKPLSLWDIDPARLENREIAIGDHCFGCTAGRGSSCQGTVA